MDLPKNLLFTKTHEWVEFVGENTARVGLTDFAQAAIGELVFINLPQTGARAEKEVCLADVVSIKSVSDIYSPFTGTVAAVNTDLADQPEKINAAPYEAWLFEITDISDKTDLLDAAAYQKVCEEEG